MTNLQKISILSAITLTLAFTSCGDTTQNSTENKTNAETSSTTTAPTDDTDAETTTTTAYIEEDEIPTESEESKVEEIIFQDNNPISLEELKQTHYLGETLYPTDIIASFIEDYFSDKNYQLYLSPYYRSNIMLVPPPSFYIDNIFDVYTIHKTDDNNVYNWGVENEKQNNLSNVSNEYTRNINVYTLYSLDDAKQFLSEEKISELQDKNIHWVIVTPHKTFDEYTEWYEDTYNEMYDRYSTENNIVIEWQDDWFEKYPSVWIVNTD